jgi:molybdopterin molybdotransferase
MVCFEMYVRPLIKRLMGDKNLFKKKIIASSGEEYEHKKRRTDFARVKFYRNKDGLTFKITGMQGSGILTSMSMADGIAIFPDDIQVIKQGSKIEVLVLKE